MNYKKTYDKLMSRGKNRILKGYSEKHHIKPKCLNGSDAKDNLVSLTAREHFIAHILLVKIYPEHSGLIKAVNMMCIFNEEQDRSKNRMYSWLKEKFSKEQSKCQSGLGNSQSKTIWISNISLEENKKISLKDEIPKGWLKGRSVWKRKFYCRYCNKIEYNLGRKNNTFCSMECKKNFKGTNKKGTKKFFPFNCTSQKDYNNFKIKFYNLYLENKSKNKTLKELGFKGNVGAYSKYANEIINEFK